jgi:fused signal recognition particle receptor
LNDVESLLQNLTTQLKNILLPCEKPLILPEDKKPFIILLVGVNGSGKTTTIGKLTKQLQKQGKKVLLAAGDTFRAAAIEQLQVWGERNNIPVIAQQPGADSAAVIFDAMHAAKARNIDVLIADTAGRLHTQHNLMDELKKIKRTIQKIDPTAPHEVLLVIDATIGQNAINQVREFNEAVGVTGLCLTKLDGTAKGGIIFAIAQQFKLPIRFIGIGETIDDLKQFHAEDFVDALLDGEEQ